VIEDEHLIAQHPEPIEILRSLVMRDGADRCLEPGDMRLERDRDPVAKKPFHARAYGSQEPGGGCR